MFPIISVIDEVSNYDKIGDYKTLYHCKLDWTNPDNHKIKRNKEWILQFLLEKRTDEETKVLEKILDESSWDEFLFPQQYKNIFSYHNSFKIPKSYYDEIKHFENLARSEWNRKRYFDTNVRENCLSVSTESVYLFFYLINDAIHIWNSHGEDYDIFENLLAVSLFRFWKNQTGSGLVIGRSLRDVRKQTENYNRLHDSFQKSLDYSVVPMRDESELRKLVKSRLRDEKINSIIK